MLKLLGRMGRREWGMAVLCALLILGQIYFDLSLPDYMSNLTVLINTPGSTSADVLRTGLEMLGCTLASAVLAVACGYLTARVAAGFGAGLREQVFHQIADFGRQEMMAFSVPSLINRTTNDITQVQMLVAMGNAMPSIISASAQFVGCLAMMLCTQWRMALAAIGVTLLGFVLMALVMVRSQKFFTARQRELSELNGYIEEMYSGHDVVRISRANGKIKQVFNGMNAQLYGADWKSQFLSGVMQPLMNIIGNLGYQQLMARGGFYADLYNSQFEQVS